MKIFTLNRRAVVVTAALLLVTFQLHAGTRVQQELGSDWRFHLGDVTGAEAASFDDATWRTLDVPHDWAFEHGYAQTNAQGAAGGYLMGGVGWYRRDFELPEAWRGRRVRLEFDGVYMNSEVWLNGHSLGKRPYGYISFGYDLKPHLRPGRNVIAVRVDNSLEPSARWYHGCGIYAPVRLVVTDAARIAPSGVQVTTPAITDKSATVRVRTEIRGIAKDAATMELATSVLDPAGKVVATQRRSLAANSEAATVEQELNVPNPQRWDLQTPRLYTVRSELVRAGQTGDAVDTRFGIREIRWDTQTGFWLNGRNPKLLGVCEHLEGGPVGAAWPDDLIRWKLQLLKDMGCNAIRVAHNPQVPRFYELCDEMGLLVMDEIFDGWSQKAKFDYGQQAFNDWWERDLRDWLKRNRNHPSIVIWSVGNETRGAVAADLVRVCHELDDSRPVTSGHSSSDVMDVFGVNGHSEKLKFTKEKRPAKPFVATEAPHTWQVRGFYRTQTWYRDGYPNKGQDPFEIPNLTPQEIFFYDWTSPPQNRNAKQVFNSSYDNATVRITARQNWELMRDLPWFSGHFRWTGFDYLGEAEYVHGGWPFRAFMGGALDLAGFPKDLYYFYQSQWTEKPMVHLLPSWTHPTLKPGTEIPVWAYSNGEEVELFLNGQSLGRKRPGRTWNEMQCEWLVPWQPGLIEAVAYRHGKAVARTNQRTAGAPAALKVTADSSNFQPNGRDAIPVTIALTDAAGVLNPYGENRVTFRVEGPARLLSLENGNPVDTEPNVNANSRRAFFGLTRAFLQATREVGDVSLIAAAILGERSQVTTNRVAIDCQRLTLRGTPKPTAWEIYYTLDGTRPTRGSTRYTGSFSVALGMTVKAAVYEQDRLLLEMQERFAADEGLYWGTEAAAALVISSGLQAEDASLAGGVVKSGGSGFHGAGYVDFDGREGHLEWYQENDGGERDVRLRIRYASGDSKSERPMSVTVNGRRLGAYNFPNTGDWSNVWQTVEIPARLRSGANRIRLQTTGQGGVNVDELQVTDVGASGQPAVKTGKLSAANY